jgi:hypothetical protein
MIPASLSRRYPYDATLDEIRALFHQRLLALEDATACATWGDPLPVAWRHGWKAVLSLVGRDQDGSLCAEITCTGPGLTRPYSRRVRLVSARRLDQRLKDGVARE